jgi:hypothetical protein
MGVALATAADPNAAAEIAIAANADRTVSLCIVDSFRRCFVEHPCTPE